MNRFKKHFVAAAILGGLTLIGIIVNSSHLVAQGPSNGLAVNIVSPLPVPVSGSTTVSGTVAATQSGAWNVGLTGSPTVAASQSGTWNVGITGMPNVNVTNPATAPVFFLNVEDPGRIPYESTNTCSGSGGCLVTFPAIPSNHRLVVQRISIATTLSSATTLFVGVGSSGGTIFIQFPVSAVTGSSIKAAADQAILRYVGAGQQPEALLNPADNTITISQAVVTLAGYLLDCSAAPCMAIAE